MKLSELKKLDEELYNKALSYSLEQCKTFFGESEEKAKESVDEFIEDDTDLKGVFAWVVSKEGHDFWEKINDSKEHKE